jgi:hypothetical protein
MQRSKSFAHASAMHARLRSAHCAMRTSRLPMRTHRLDARAAMAAVRAAARVRIPLLTASASKRALQTLPVLPTLA